MVKQGERVEQDEEDIDSSYLCLICYEPLFFVAVLQCNHNNCCSLCMMKLRLIEKDRACIICKQQSANIIITAFVNKETSKIPAEVIPSFTNLKLTDNKRQPVKRTQKPIINTFPMKKYEDFMGSGTPATWDEDLNSRFKHADQMQNEMLFDEEAEVYFHGQKGHEEYARLVRLRQYRCGVETCEQKEQAFKGIWELNTHLTKAHSLALCRLCAEARKQFVMELNRWKKPDLLVHLERGNPAKGMSGHPKCGFCKSTNKMSKGRPVRFYDNDALYQHLNQVHEYCHVCRKDGKMYEYFNNRQSLFKHFKKKHFICEEPECKDSFVVFASDYELKGHFMRKHPHIQIDRAIQANFTIRRLQADGSGAAESAHTSEPTMSFDVPDQFRFDYHPEEFPVTSLASIQAATPALGGGEQEPSLGDGATIAAPDLGMANFHSSGRWAITAGNANRVTSKLENEEMFPSLNTTSRNARASSTQWSKKPGSIKSVLGPFGVSGRRPGSALNDRLNSKAAGSNSFSNAVSGPKGNQLARQSDWEEARKVRTGTQRPLAKQLLVSKAEASLHSRSGVKQTTRPTILHVLQAAQKPVLSSSIKARLNNKVNLIHNFQTIVSNYNNNTADTKTTYEAIYHLFPASATKSSNAVLDLAFPEILKTIKDVGKRNALGKFHTDVFTGSIEARPSHSSATKLSYLNVDNNFRTRNRPAVKLNEDQFPKLNPGKVATGLHATWGNGVRRTAGKFNMDDWLKENAPSKVKKKEPVKIGKGKKSSSSKRKGGSRQLTDLF